MSGKAAWEFAHVELNVQEARPGDHFIRVAVTDLNGGAQAEREGSFWIEKEK